jgi:spore coat protein U-like protein
MIKRTLATLAVLALASSALADTKSASTQVSLTVLPDCTISSTDMDLGIYNARTGASGTSTVRVKCNMDYEVLYSGFSGNLTHTIVNTETVPYTVAYTKNGGSSSALATLVSPATGDFVPYAFPGVLTGANGNQYDEYLLTGNVASGLWKLAGTYQELITFTLNFNLD